jgi:4-amino-4-deoxy-L-arabinose transferase-like glycosyltransferase
MQKSGIRDRVVRFWVAHPAILDIVVLALLALAIRVLFFQEYRLEGTDCDGAGYMGLARHIRAGEGWLSDYYRILFLPLPPLPGPNACWSPLYPLLTAISYLVAGSTFTAAKLVPLVFGVLIPPAGYLLGLGLSGRRLPGLLAGLLALIHPVLVTMSLRIETESLTIFMVTVILGCLLLWPRRGWLLGLLLGVAFLAKYQSMWLWPTVALGIFLSLTARQAWRSLAVAGVVFLLVCSPWMVRNYRVFGDPTYTDLKHLALLCYPEFGGVHQFLASPTAPPSLVAYARAHPMNIIKFVRYSAPALIRQAFKDDRGSLLLAPLALLGMWCLGRRWRRWLPILLYAGLLSVFISMTIPNPRYLTNLVPIWLVLAGAGADWLGIRFRTPGRAGVLVGLLVAVLVAGSVVEEGVATVRAATDRAGEWCPSANYCCMELLSCRPWVLRHTAPTDRVFSCEVYHGAYLLERPAIAVPYDETQLARLRARTGARVLAISLRDLRKRLPAWEQRPPAWAELVDRIPADSIRLEFPRGARNPVLSEMRIYRLSGVSL